jgi:hypothetical protein
VTLIFQLTTDVMEAWPTGTPPATVHVRPQANREILIAFVLT